MALIRRCYCLKQNSDLFKVVKIDLYVSEQMALRIATSNSYNLLQWLISSFRWYICDRHELRYSHSTYCSDLWP